MVSVGFQRPGPSGTGPGAIDPKVLVMIIESLWGPQILFFSKVVAKKLVEDDNNECFSWFPKARTIWDRSTHNRPQGVGHDNGQPVSHS